MVFTLKSISNKINKELFDEKVPIRYKKEEPNIDQNSVVSFACISGSERERYENLDEPNQKEFVSTSEYISIPMINLEKLYEIYHVGITYDYDGTIDMIKKVIVVDKDNEKILFALFLILHEFGHWNDFVSKGRKPYAYTQDKDEQKDVYDFKRKILNDESLCHMSEYKIREKMREYFNRYNSVPGEKRANEYALSKLCDAYKILKNEGI